MRIQFACAIAPFASLLATTVLAQVAEPPVTSTPADPANYASGAGLDRGSLTYVVIHKSEGTEASAVSWFQDPAAQVSAHYVVGQDGSIDQCVDDPDIAWHAGNHDVNLASIGIEHAGFSSQADTTAEQYEASARLVAWICTTFHVPIDRSHVIGHSEVPDPNHPGEWGGANHHTSCPGPNWDWTRFMSLVEQYAAGAAATSSSAPPGAANPDPSDPTLSLGDQGSAVATLQTLLNSWRARVGDSLLTVDGSFGPETFAAVEGFQGADGLAATGVVAQDTWDALRKP
jgi:N-acetyl-anhydromuramyl-L-alanine amidase AmpD